MKNKLICILLLALATVFANAQDDFNPALPGEPNALYKVTVGISSSAAGQVYGGGSFATGSQITISRSDAEITDYSTVAYQFKYWTLNGEEYTSAAQDYSFEYTVETENVKFEAVYEMVDIEEVTSRVFVQADPSDACSIYIWGERHREGSDVYIYYYDSYSAFKFQGWYDGEELISSDQYFYYTVGEEDVTLTARFTYEPAMPGEPNADQEDVDNEVLMGDVNNDNLISIADVAALIGYLKGATIPNFNTTAANVDHVDGIDQRDVTLLVNIILGKNL